MSQPSLPSKTQARAWQRMLSGRRLDLLDPSPMDIEIEDIAHGLARVARWNGQTRGEHPFSVAQHSLLVASIAQSLEPHAEPELALYALLHDAPEYVIGDIISPFKALIGETYKKVENRLLHAIHLRFGLKSETPRLMAKTIKVADQASAYWEAVALADFTQDEADRFFKKPEIGAKKFMSYLTPWPTAEAEQAYLSAFKQHLEAWKG
jgi:uncharacterized protein